MAGYLPRMLTIDCRCQNYWMLVSPECCYLSNFRFCHPFAVWGVYDRIFPSIDLDFCSNVFRSFTFVASLVFFLATWLYAFFSFFCRVLISTRFFLTFSLSLAVFVTLEFAPVFCCGVEKSF